MAQARRRGRLGVGGGAARKRPTVGHVGRRQEGIIPQVEEVEQEVESVVRIRQDIPIAKRRHRRKAAGESVKQMHTNEGCAAGQATDSVANRAQAMGTWESARICARMSGQTGWGEWTARWPKRRKALL